MTHLTPKVPIFHNTIYTMFKKYILIIVLKNYVYNPEGYTTGVGQCVLHQFIILFGGSYNLFDFRYKRASTVGHKRKDQCWGSNTCNGHDLQRLEFYYIRFAYVNNIYKYLLKHSLNRTTSYWQLNIVKYINWPIVIHIL